MIFSIIIPLYNRPDEIEELLASLTLQDYFIANPNHHELVELIVVEDGSTISSHDVVAKYSSELNIHYFVKGNQGPAVARNHGVARSSGEWLVFIDSDCVLPPGWLSAMVKGTEDDNIDLFGGPDCASPDFTVVQRAINYSMTSLFTTGGIRGSKRSMEKFHPRSFNMGIRRSMFNQVGQFSTMRFGEDIDLSIRLMQAGARSGLLPDAWVYHKRRVDFVKFFRQVRASGTARIALWHKHPSSLKFVHLLPTMFTLYLPFTAITMFITIDSLIPLALWALLIVIDATIKNRNLLVGILGLLAAIVQLSGYGIGFLWAICGGGSTADKDFYK